MSLGRCLRKARGDKVAIQFANNPILKQQVEAGARFDVLIIEPDMLDDLTKQGKIVAGSRADVARVGMALLARAGAPKPDISTIEGFKNVLRNAESVAYTADGHSGTVFLRTLERLGLLEEMKPRLRPDAMLRPSSRADGRERRRADVRGADLDAVTGQCDCRPLPRRNSNLRWCVCGS